MVGGDVDILLLLHTQTHTHTKSVSYLMSFIQIKIEISRNTINKRRYESGMLVRVYKNTESKSLTGILHSGQVPCPSRSS